MLNTLSAWFSGRSTPSSVTDDIQLPPDLPNWALAKELLQELQGRLINDNISDQNTGWFLQTVYNTIQSTRPFSGSASSRLKRLRTQIQSDSKKKLDQNCLWFGMLKYLRKTSREEKENFLYSVLPRIIELALDIEESRPRKGLHFLKQQKDCSITLSRQFVCSVVACYFLCLFPERKRESSSMTNIVNFTMFFKHLPLPSQIAKLQCILHYFECIIERGMEVQGEMVFCRKVARADQMLTFDDLINCDLKLCPLTIHPDGIIENSGAGTIQVDFANKSIGGGVLGRSRVQEEIRFSICPELLAAMLFMENMEANEAILISGFEQFSDYTGYAESLQFAGHHTGANQLHTMVAIDAVSYRGSRPVKQYEESSVLRDLNKALIGFTGVSGDVLGMLSARDTVTGEEGRSGAVDIAADMVTSVLTDAIRQAAESPVSPEKHTSLEEALQQQQFSRQQQASHPSLLHEPLPSSSSSPLSVQQQYFDPAFQDRDVQSYGDSSVDPPSYHKTYADSSQITESSGTAGALGNIQVASTTAAFTLSSGNVDTQAVSDYAHSTLPPTSTSPSSPFSTVSSSLPNVTSVSVSTQPVHSTGESFTVASTHTAQVPCAGLRSSSAQQTQALGDPAVTQVEANETISSVSHIFPDSSSTAAAISLKASKDSETVGGATGISRPVESSAFSEDFSCHHVVKTAREGGERHFASDVLGNLTKTASAAYSKVPFFPATRHGASGDVKRQQTPAVGKSGASSTQYVKSEFSNVLKDSTDESLAFLLPEHLSTDTEKSEEAVPQDLIAGAPEYKQEDLQSIDVVLSLPAWQSSLERVGSELSNFSMVVNVGSPNLSTNSLSTNSVEETSHKRPATEVLYVNVEDDSSNHGRGYSVETFGREERRAGLDAALLEPPLSTSPQSSVSSTNLSPNASFVLQEPFYHEPVNGSSDVHVTADFFLPSSEGTNNQSQSAARRGSRDFYGELREFLNSSSSGSRGSGSGGPVSSTHSSWGSRSGSLSSHGTNGSTNDFLEFWNHFRRRSSQMSDATSRRSSSSKHSSDFSTDLEEISEGSQKHSHGVIEEEGGGLLTVLADFASQFASVAVKNGVATGAHLSAVARPEEEEVGLMNVERPETLESKDSVVEKTGSEGVPDIVVGIVPKAKPARVAPLVRQKEVEQDDVTHSESVGGEDLALVAWVPDSQTERLVEKEIGISAGGSSTTQDSSTAESALFSSSPSSAAVGPTSNTSSSSTKIPPIPTLTQSDMPVMSVRMLQQLGERDSSQSTDSGFVSAKSSVTSALGPRESQPVSLSAEPVLSFIHSEAAQKGEKKDEAAVDTETEVASLLSSSPRVPREADVHTRTSVTSTTEPGQVTPITTTAKANIPQPKAQTLYATLETKTIFLSPENLPAAMPSQDQPAKELLLTSVPSTVSRQRDAKLSETVETEVPAPKDKAADSSDIYQRSTKLSGVSDSKSKTRSLARADNSKMSKMKNVEMLMGSASAPHSASQPSSGASGAAKSSGIPKYRKSSKKVDKSEYAKVPAPPSDKSKTSEKSNVPTHSKSRAKTGKVKNHTSPSLSYSPQQSAKGDEPVFAPHKSRYVFSDVAAPLTERKKRSRTTATEASSKRQSGSSRAQEERKRRHKKDQGSAGAMVKSSKFTRFVNSLAEISLSQAVLEGAEILSQTPSSRQGLQEISDEVYNWFASKIVNEVFLHVINNMDTLLGPNYNTGSIEQAEPQEIGASDVIAQHVTGQAAAPSIPSSQAAAETAVPKLKSIMPTKSDIAASGSKGSGQLKSTGSFKMVKFKESRGDSDEQDTHVSSFPSSVVTSSPARTSVSSTFHRSSSTSSIPIPIRRRSSLVDLPSCSPPAAGASSLSTSHQSKSSTSSARQTGIDIPLDVYQAAATIVNQVFQNISESVDLQALSPVSSGPHGTVSSFDTGVHSTGSRIHSHYDSIASNIFSSTSTKPSESPKRTRRSVSPSIGVFSRKPMSRETLTNAFLKTESTPHIKSYERRSSEPCQTSVQLSLQAFNSIKFTNKAVEDKQRKISRTDDDIGRGKTWRRGSLDGFSFERRNSCGFKDPVLSRFAEELMKADTSVPELVIVGSHPGSSTSGSRRSSVSAFRDTTLANLESELLNTSFTSVCSLPLSHSPRSLTQSQRSHLDRSRSRESRNWKSDSSDTEYWFPPPRLVGDEFQQEYNRQHSQDELQDYASFFAGRVVQEAVCVLRCDPDFMSKEEQDVDVFAENLTDQIMRDALLTSIRGEHVDGSAVPASMEGGDGDRGTVDSSSESTLFLQTYGMGDSIEHRPYFGEGARPKTKFQSASGSPNTQSKPRTIPRRREIRRTCSSQEYYLESAEVSGLTLDDERRERTTSVGSSGIPTFQQYFHPGAQAPQTDWGGARPKQSQVSHRKLTYDPKSSSAKFKRHSSPASIPSSASSLSPSWKPQPASLQVPSRKQQQQLRLRGRSHSESASSTSSIPLYRRSGHFRESAKPGRDKREESPASMDSVSSNSSYHSEQTGSSLLSSSSGSEGIGPTGRDSHHKKLMLKRRPDQAGKTSHIPRGKSYKTSISESQSLKKRGLKEDLDSRKGDRESKSTRRRCKGKTEQWAEPSESEGGAGAVIEEFAANLSVSVIDSVLQHCREHRWLRFPSYHRPIATGNWGCGAFQGNAQLKMVIQWLAASVAQAPGLLYYTFNDQRMLQAQEIADLLSGWTVGQLATALHDYCSWVQLHLSSSLTSSSSSSFSLFSPSSSTRLPQYRQTHQSPGPSHSAWQAEHDAQLPQSFFDFLREKFQKENER